VFGHEGELKQYGMRKSRAGIDRKDEE